MARIPLATRDQVADKEKSAYDAFMASRAAGNTYELEAPAHPTEKALPAS